MKSKNNLWEFLWIFIGGYLCWLSLCTYVELYGVWKSLELNNDTIDGWVSANASYFYLPLSTRLVSLVIPVIVMVTYDKFSKKSKPALQSCALFGIGALIFILPALLKFAPRVGITWVSYLYAAFYIVGTLGGALLLMVAAIRLSAYLMGGGLIDNERESDGFMQNTAYMDNPESINLPMSFKYQGKKYDGWVNVVNPFRASMVTGTPGSGKSFALIEVFHQQWLEKLNEGRGIVPAMLGYDYKFPALTSLCYGDYQNVIEKYKKTVAPKTMPDFDLLSDYRSYKEWIDKENKDRESHGLSKYPIAPEIAIISFTHPSLSFRCNPFKYIASSAGAGSMAEVIYTSLNRSAAEKKDEFFTKSAKIGLTLYIMFCLRYKGGKYCTLPHTIGLLSKDEKEVFPIFELYTIFFPELVNLFAPFKGAYDSNALEQLQGQLGSARIGLSYLNDDMIKFILTEDQVDPTKNIDLEVNDPNNPKILWVGNDGGENEDIKQKDKKEVIYGAAISAIFAAALPLVNKQGKIPSMITFDELPTIYVEGLSELIATARSNKVAILFGLQDRSQGKRDYGDRVWTALANTVGNVFSGAVKAESAKVLSEAFGEKKVKKQSESISGTGDVSFNISDHLEKKIPQNIIENLSQGEFVGMVADNRDQYIEHKEFCCQFKVNPKSKRKGEMVSHYSSEQIEEMRYRIKSHAREIDREINGIILDTKDLVDALAMAKSDMGKWTGTVKLKNPKPEDKLTVDDILNSFKDKSILAMKAACIFFENLYWISSQIPVYDYEYEPGDNIRAKARVLDVPYSDNDSDQEIIDRLNMAASRIKAEMLLKYLCPSTALFEQFLTLMDEEFLTYSIAKSQSNKMSGMLEEIEKEPETAGELDEGDEYGVSSSGVYGLE